MNKRLKKILNGLLVLSIAIVIGGIVYIIYIDVSVAMQCIKYYLTRK